MRVDRGCELQKYLRCDAESCYHLGHARFANDFGASVIGHHISDRCLSK